MNFRQSTSMDLDGSNNKSTTEKKVLPGEDGVVDPRLQEFLIKKLPSNDHGRVRQPWDADAYQMKYILPAPRHDFSYDDRSGWRFHPRAKFLDRLGESPPVDVPITKEPLSLHYDTTVDKTMVSVQRAGGDTTTLQQAMGDMVVDPKKKDDNDNIMEDDDDTTPPNNKNTRKEMASSMSTPPDSKRSKLSSGSNPQNPDQHQPDISCDATVVTHSTAGTNPQQGSVVQSPAVASTDKKQESTQGNATETATTYTQQSTRQSTGSIRMAVGAIPKASLYSFYGKKPRRVQLSSTDYITWDNGAKTHELRFTSVFICPITKEVFPAGCYGDTYENSPTSNLVWYAKKSTAEHAAAARALDCWNLRENLDMGRHVYDEPYLEGNGPKFPFSQIKPEAKDAIEKAREEAVSAAAAAAAAVGVSGPAAPDVVSEEETTVATAGTEKGSSASKASTAATRNSSSTAADNSSSQQTATGKSNEIARKNQGVPPPPPPPPPPQTSKPPPPPPPRREHGRNKKNRGNSYRGLGGGRGGGGSHYGPSAGLPPSEWSSGRGFPPGGPSSRPHTQQQHQQHAKFLQDGRGYNDGGQRGSGVVPPVGYQQQQQQQQAQFAGGAGGQYNDQYAPYPGPYGDGGSGGYQQGGNEYYQQGSYGNSSTEYYGHAGDGYGNNSGGNQYYGEGTYYDSGGNEYYNPQGGVGGGASRNDHPHYYNRGGGGAGSYGSDGKKQTQGNNSRPGPANKKQGWDNKHGHAANKG